MVNPSNTNDAYYKQLTDYSRQRGGPEPIFSVADTKCKPNRLRGKDWDNICVDIAFDVYEEDLEVFRSSKSTPKRLQAYLAYMTSEAKRTTEVTFSRLSPSEKTTIPSTRLTY